MRSKILILFLGACFCSVDSYSIKWLGFHVANCNISTSDTLINGSLSTKLDYKVTTKPIMKWFFNVNNQYITIINKSNNNIEFFSKKTSQPGLENQIIKTIKKNGIVKYLDSSYAIEKNEYNIFSLLYLISLNKGKHLNYVKLDREGKKYHCNINNIGNQYFLAFNEEDNHDEGFIKNTDIFSWALFLPNTKKNIQIDSINQKIEFCRFKKGLLTFTADKIK